MVGRARVGRPTGGGSIGAPAAVAKRLIDRVDRPRPPDSLQQNWTNVPADVGLTVADRQRLERDRTEIVPWLHRTRSLADRRLLEVGCGHGLSTIALAEQGASVVGLDVEPSMIHTADSRIARCDLRADFVAGNAADIGSTFGASSFDWVVFWAALEHMTLDERMNALEGAWNATEPGGLITIIETPNRLWYFDSHTAQLPFYMWLPDELAYRTATDSPRAGFADRYGDADLTHMDEFRRRGRGVGHHEFDVAWGNGWRNQVVACMQLERRAANPLRRVGWRLSRAGRYEAILRSVAPDVPRACFQPMLYLTVQKP